jgi:hypothetical protein
VTNWFEQAFVNSHSILIEIEHGTELESNYYYFLVAMIAFFAQKINAIVSGGFATNSGETILILDICRERVLHNVYNIGDIFHARMSVDGMIGILTFDARNISTFDDYIALRRIFHSQVRARVSHKFGYKKLLCQSLYGHQRG